jgi:transposase-like protein
VVDKPHVFEVSSIRWPDGKAIVAAVLERGGTVRAKVCSTRRKAELQALVRDNVEAGSNLYSDALKSYDGLDEFQHQVVDHAVEHVNGNVHTSGLENVWSLLKRSLKGSYVSVEPFHLFRYLDEQAFRYNNRDMTELDRFVYVMRHIVGRRLTYKRLTWKVEVAHGGLSTQSCQTPRCSLQSSFAGHRSSGNSRASCGGS